MRSQDVENEIKKAKYSAFYSQNTYSNIYNKIVDLKDNNNDNISYLIEYEHFNKKTKKNENLNMFIIITKTMMKEIRNKDIYQFFGDAT